MESSILPIFAYGNDVLRGENVEINFGENIDHLATKMFLTMKNASGIGLAAPQIGKNIKVFVIDISPFKEDYPKCSFYKEIFINPEIVEEQGAPWTFTEGCLSIPDVMVDVMRKPGIAIQYHDQDWNKKKITVDGILARVIQHEYDHLNGVLHIDYASDIEKKAMEKTLNDIHRGNIDPKYKMQFSN